MSGVQIERLTAQLAAAIGGEHKVPVYATDGRVIAHRTAYFTYPEAEVLAAVVVTQIGDVQADVANAFVAWAAKNEIAEPPLDWAWFGEIARLYSPLHEAHTEATS